MLKRLTAGLLLLATAAFPQAWTRQTPARPFQYYIYNASTTMTAVGATNSMESASNNHTLQVVVVSPATCTVRLEGSNDGATWADLSGSQACTASTMFHVDGKFVSYVRAYLITYSGDAPQAVVTITYTGTR